MKGEPPLRVCHLGNDPHFSFFLKHTGRLQPAVCIHSCILEPGILWPPRALPALAPSSSLSSWHPFVSFFSFPTSHSGIPSSIHASACLPAALFIFIFPYSPPVSPVSCCFVVSLFPLSSLFLSAPPQFHVLRAGQPPCELCSELSIPPAVQEKMQRIPPFPGRYLGSAPWLPTAGCRSCWQEPVVWWSDTREAASPLFLLLSPWRGAERVPGFPSAKGREAQKPGSGAGQSGDLACHRRAHPALTLLQVVGLLLKQKEFRGNASMELFGILSCPLCNAAVPGGCPLPWAGSMGAPCPQGAHLLTPQCHRPMGCRAPSCCFQPGTRDFPGAALCWLVVSLPSTTGIVSRFWGAREEQHHEGLRAALGNTA